MTLAKVYGANELAFAVSRWAKTAWANCANCANRFPQVVRNIGCLRPVTRVSATSVSVRRLGPEMRAQHGGGLVVGLDALLQEAGQRKEAVDGAGIVHIGRLDAGLDQPVGIGAALVAQRVVARCQHEGGGQAGQIPGQQWPDPEPS